MDQEDIKKRIIEIIQQKKPETIQNLFDIVKIEYPIKLDDFMEQVLELQEQNIIYFKEIDMKSKNMQNHLFSSRSLWFWSTLLVILLTNMSIYLIPENKYPLNYLRYIFSTIFLIYLPGYSFIKAMYPAKEIDKIERFALSIGSSIAIVPFIGFLLNYTIWEIRLTPIVICLTILIIMLSIIGLYREYTVIKS
jgi:uncharacterized membrane protein